MATSKFIDIMSYWTLTVIVIIYPVTLILGCYNFHKYRNKQYFIHRNKPLLIALICSATLIMYIVVLPGVLTFGFNIKILKDDTNNWSLLFLIGYGLSIPCFTIFALRYFDLAIKIIHTQQTKKWKLLLNPQHYKNNFITKYYHILKRYQLITATLFYVIGYGAIIMVFFITNMNIKQIYIGPAIFIVMICIFSSICLYKIGKFADFWYIRIELWTLSIGCICVVPLLIIITTIEFTMAEQTALLVTSTSISCTLLVFTICLFPVFFNERRDKKMRRKTKSDIQRLYGLMQDKNGYEALMDHLEHEFSTENLLFLTEMIQFRDYLRSKYPVYLNHEKAMELFENQNINLPENAPKSAIFEKKKRTPSEIFVVLYKKYIEKYNAELEVNISYGLNLSLKQHYQLISISDEEQIATEITVQMSQMIEATVGTNNDDLDCFIMAWNNLVMATREVTSILHHSAGRCPYKIV